MDTIILASSSQNTHSHLQCEQSIFLSLYWCCFCRSVGHVTWSNKQDYFLCRTEHSVGEEQHTWLVTFAFSSVC